MFDSKKLDNLVKNGFHKNLLTKFLSIEEQKYLQSQKRVFIAFNDTYPSEERKRAFLSKEEIDEPISFNIEVLEFSYNTKYYYVGHRDTLGALMALGISRDVIGDIIIGSRNFIIVCRELSKHIQENLKSIGRANIDIRIASLEELQSIKIVNYQNDQIIVSSKRLDTILSQIAKVSRSSATKIIQDNFVKVNGVYQLNSDYLVKYDDIISIKGIGRIIIKEEIKITKKNKIILSIMKTL